MAHVPMTGPIKLGGHIAKEYAEAANRPFHLGSFHSAVFENFWTYSGSLQGTTGPMPMSKLRGCGFAVSNIGQSTGVTNTVRDGMGFNGNTCKLINKVFSLPEFHFSPSSRHFITVKGSWSSKGTHANAGPWGKGFLTGVYFKGGMIWDLNSPFQPIGKMYTQPKTPTVNPGADGDANFSFTFEIDGAKAMSIANPTDDFRVMGELDASTFPSTGMTISVVNVYASAGTVAFGINKLPDFQTTSPGKVGYSTHDIQPSADSEFVNMPTPSHMAAGCTGNGVGFQKLTNAMLQNAWSGRGPAAAGFQSFLAEAHTFTQDGRTAGPNTFNTLAVNPVAPGANHRMYFELDPANLGSGAHSQDFWAGNFD